MVITFISSEVILLAIRFIGIFQYLRDRVLSSANKLNLKKLELFGKSFI